MHFFNSFFFKKLTEQAGEPASSSASRHEQNHERVRKWTKVCLLLPTPHEQHSLLRLQNRSIMCLCLQGKDIFEKNYLFVPIHDHLHWSLLIVCHPAAFLLQNGHTSCLLLLDSMDGKLFPRVQSLELSSGGSLPCMQAISS